jgi:outer membrane protein TolC
MNSKTHFITLFFTTVALLNVLSARVSAQDSVRNLHLDEAIAATLDNNRNIQLAKIDENIADAGYKQTEAVFLPQVGLSYTALSTNNPLNAFGFKLQQSSITPNDFNPALLNHPAATADFMTMLEVQQPILNMDLLYLRKGAEKQKDVYRYKTQRTREYLTFEVEQAYFQLLLAYNAAKVLDEALETAKSVYTFTDNHFKQGLIQKSDLLNARLQITAMESGLNKAQSNIRNACDDLSLLMGQKTDVIYKIDEATPDEFSEADTTRSIAASRPDFMAMQTAIEASNLAIKSSQMSYLPKLNAFGNYQYNDGHLTGFGANAYFLGLRLSWDVFKGNKTKNTIITQKLERDKLSEQLAQQKDESQSELNKAWRDLSDARFEIAQEKAAIGQAAEALRILQNRYRQGLVNTTDVLQAETQLSQRKFALAQARFTESVTRAYIQFLTASSK